MVFVAEMTHPLGSRHEACNRTVLLSTMMQRLINSVQSFQVVESFVMHVRSRANGARNLHSQCAQVSLPRDNVSYGAFMSQNVFGSDCYKML